MNTSSFPSVGHNDRSIPRDLGRCTLWLLWQCIRLPILLVLVTLEPVVNLVLGLFALLGLLTAIFWELAGPPGFPCLLIVTISLGFQFALLVYQILLRLLSR
jgi:hypothetical protein